MLRRLAAVLLLLSLSCAAAQETYRVEATNIESSKWIQAGQGFTVQFHVTSGESPVAGAQIELGTPNGPVFLTPTGDEGYTTYAVSSNDAQVFELEAEVASVNGDPVASTTWTGNVVFTMIDLAMEAPAGPHEVGSDVPLTLLAVWRHDGSPVADLSVQLLNAGQEVVTDADGEGQTTVTKDAPGDLDVSTVVDPGDRPHGIGYTAASVSVEFVEASSGDGGSNDGGASNHEGSSNGGGNSGGGSGSPDGSGSGGSGDAGSDDAEESDDENGETNVTADDDASESGAPGPSLGEKTSGGDAGARIQDDEGSHSTPYPAILLVVVFLVLCRGRK